MIAGIAGELRFDRTLSDRSTVRTMCNAQIRRGPDGENYYTEKNVSLGIRHRSTGDVPSDLWPLRNEDGRIHLVSDGQIYDSRTLRLELESCGHRFFSRTSMETIVHGYEEWGTKCLEKLDGMFAFSLWDEPRQLLWLARDRFGIKPLHYYRGKNFLAFASGIEPLLRHPEISAGPNERAVRGYMESGSTGIEDETFFDAISRLPPASHLMIRSDGSLQKLRYWRLPVSKISDCEISSRTVARTRDLFLDAVGQQLLTDLPVGASLSGGIDSSSVVCAAKRIQPSGLQLRSYSASFPSDPLDEMKYVRVVCDEIEIENDAVKLTADDFWRDLPSLVRCQEEPLLSFVYAHWRLMRRASEQDVRVMLEGHGGDELLCGYVYYFFYYLIALVRNKKWRKLVTELLPSWDVARDETKRLMTIQFPRFGPWLASLISRFLEERSHISVRQSRLPRDAPIFDFASRMEFDASLGSLPEVLRYVDRNSAWHGVEIRCPFLQKTFAEHCASLPLDHKLRQGWTKYAFRLAMRGILPERIRLRRVKIGFQLPLERWIENELRQRLKHFFSDPNLKATRYYSPETARNILSKRTLTTRDTEQVWRMLNVELWYREFL